MVLGIIALVIALAALALGIFNAVRVFNLEKEAERLNWVLKGHEISINAINEKPAEPAVILGLEGVRYDPETSTMTIDGNLNVNGWLVSGGIKEEKKK